MIIRRAKIDDIEGIEKLLYQVHDVHVQIRPDLFKKGYKKYIRSAFYALRRGG